MAVHEKATPLLSAVTKVTNGVAAAVVDRFVELVPASTAVDAPDVRTMVPGAGGGIPVGILAMRADVKPFPNPGSGYATVGIMNIPGAQATIELAEACAANVNLRVGGNGAEVDGAAYLADAAGDIIAAKSLEAGVIGQIISIIYLGNGGVAP